MINPQSEIRDPKSFTLIELLVVVAIIAVLVAVLLPGLHRARQLAIQTACAANLRQHGMGWRMYADDFRGKVPIPHDDWRVFFCWSTNYPAGIGMLVRGGYIPMPIDINVWGDLYTFDVRKRGICACPAIVPMSKFLGHPNFTTYVGDWRSGRVKEGGGPPAYHWGYCSRTYNWAWFEAWGNLDKMSPDRAQQACLLPMHPGGTNVMFAGGHVQAPGLELTMIAVEPYCGGFTILDRHDPEKDINNP